MKSKISFRIVVLFFMASLFGCVNSSQVATDSSTKKIIIESKKTEQVSEVSIPKPSIDKEVDSIKEKEEEKDSKKIDGYEIMATTNGSGRVKILYSYPYLSLSNGVVASFHRPPYKEVVFSELGSKQMLVWKPMKEKYPFGHFYNQVPYCQIYRKKKTLKVHGLKCTLYEGFKTKSSKVPIVRYTATKEFKNPKSFDIAQSANMNRPLGMGFTLKLQGRERFSGSHQWRDLYVTDSITKKKISVSKFEVPKGFKRVKDVGDFLAGGKLGIEDFFEYKFDK